MSRRSKVHAAAKRKTPQASRTTAWARVQVFIDDCLAPAPSSAAPPWRYLPHLLLLAFVLRATLALSGDFILHPDEIMQYLEPAHGLVFGNSVLHWEYYYGGRSWLVPGGIAAILFLCKHIGLGEPAYYIPAVKLTLCAFSLLIPLCMYHLGRRLFSETTARTALLLGVFWYELVGFAHKPMTEFIATGLFLALLTFILRPQRLTPAQAATASAFAVLVVAVRLQYAPLLALVWLIPFWRGCPHTRLLMLVATVAAVCAVGLFDKLTWGEFLQPYRINYYFNASLDKSRISYEDTAGRYALWLGIASGGLVLAALAGVFASRQRVFLLLLMLAVLVPHEMQVHREYRFLFVLVPLWLLLCADVLCAGWRSKHTAANGRWRHFFLLGWAVLASTAGIANALPGQHKLYEYNYINPGNYPYAGNFLRNQDELLFLYRQLAADDTVRGVKDAVHRYYESGGYYTLHHKVPFYDRQILHTTDAQEYVSHIIAPPLIPAQDAQRRSDGKWVVIAQDGSTLELPTYAGEAGFNTLMYWDENGKASAIREFSLAASGRQFTLWKATSSASVRNWKKHRVYLPNEADHQLLEESASGMYKPPLTTHDFEFAENVAPQ